jgi:polyhydroxyalkanoate synthesis regulator phasin
VHTGDAVGEIDKDTGNRFHRHWPFALAGPNLNQATKKKGRSAMSDNPQKESTDRLVEAYEKMVHQLHEGVEHLEKQTLPNLRDRLAAVREKMVELGELSREEAEKVSGYLQRDLEDAAHFIAETNEEFRQWLRFDVELIEDRLLNSLAKVADQTSLQLKAWADRARRTPYHTGEVTGPGSLACIACGRYWHYTKTGTLRLAPIAKPRNFAG